MNTRTLLAPSAWLALIVWSGLTPGAAAWQLIPSPPAPPANPADLALDSTLFEAEALAGSRQQPADSLQAELGRRGIRLDADRRVHVCIVAQGSRSLNAAQVSAVGGRIDAQALNQTDAWIPVTRLSEFTRALGAGFLVRRIGPMHLDDEGPEVTNSETYRNAGADGSGLTIAIIDSQYSSLTWAQNNGDAPPGAVRIDYTSGPFESGGTHGTACVETAFDHAPGASYRLYKIDSDTDLVTAVSDCVGTGVDIISHSMSNYNKGWDDDLGLPCFAANTAAINGVLYFCSAGNRANQHWQGNFNPGLGSSGWHDWVTGDESISIIMPAWSSLSFYLSWDPSGGTYNHDLYLFNSDGSQILASSTNSGNNFEAFQWSNNNAVGVTVQVSVFKVSGGTTELELFTHGSGGQWQEHAIAAGSTTSPSNSTHPEVVSVGAVAHVNYDDAAGSDPIMSYSSRGPSNSGMLLPDLCGPTLTDTLSTGAFGGTSCATPNVAGLAAALWSADPLLDATAIRFLLEQQAAVFRDWGTPGIDNTYGPGGAYLTDHAPDTIWLSNYFNNPQSLRKWPFNNFFLAHAAAVNGGRLLMLPGGSYPGVTVVNKQLSVETLGGIATIGQ